MNYELLRESFSVFVADSDLGRGGELAKMLADVGYLVEHRVDKKSLDEQIVRNPPHMIFFHLDDHAFLSSESDIHAVVENLKAKLPETHIFYLCPENRLSEAIKLLTYGVDDIFVWPLRHPSLLIRSLDRSALSDFYLYKNEQQEGESHRRTRSDESSFAFLEVFQKALKKDASRNELLKLALKELASRFKTNDAYYFRYVPGAGTLVLALSVGQDLQMLDSVGLHLKKDEPGFTEESLLQPNKIRILREFVLSGLGRMDLAAFPHIEGNVVRGVFVVPSAPDQVFPEYYSSDPYAEICLTLLRDRMDFIDLKSKYARLSVYDEESEALRADYLQKKIIEEVSRARRLSRPVSLLLVSIDSYEDIALEQTALHMNNFLTAFVGILVKNSRLNDLIGRLDRDRFALVLPHTPKRGAAIKAERIRRTIEGADFSKVLAGRVRITVSIGVSEYPAVCHDVDGLLRSAEEALTEVQRFGSNRVCLATPVTGFIADFASENG